MSENIQVRLSTGRTLSTVGQIVSDGAVCLTLKDRREYISPEEAVSLACELIKLAHKAKTIMRRERDKKSST